MANILLRLGHGNIHVYQISYIQVNVFKLVSHFATRVSSPFNVNKHISCNLSLLSSAPYSTASVT